LIVNTLWENKIVQTKQMENDEHDWIGTEYDRSELCQVLCCLHGIWIGKILVLFAQMKRFNN